jgi:hypothetical protein
MGEGNSCTTAETVVSPSPASYCDSDLPTIIVFDLDDCLWTPEMHELSGMPSIPVEGPLDPTDVEGSTLGTVGMKVPSSSRRGGRRGFDWGGLHAADSRGEIVELYPGARRTLRELATNPKYREVKIAVASTSLEPAYSRACIDGIEVVEGVTMGDMISYSQIGRSGRLTSRKTGHFRLIHEESGGRAVRRNVVLRRLQLGRPRGRHRQGVWGVRGADREWINTGTFLSRLREVQIRKEELTANDMQILQLRL